MNFDPKFILWIKNCISTPSFSITLNGSLRSFFGNSNGLNQGDPISFYLFVHGMTILYGVLNKNTQDSNFKFHWKCFKSKLHYLCFANDLFLFSNGDVQSNKILKKKS